MRRMRFAIATVAVAALAGSGTAAAAADRGGEVRLTDEVQRAYADFVASDRGQLIERQIKMASPSFYLADVARGVDETGADPADYWYVRIGLHDDGMSLAPQASLYANLQRLKKAGAIEDVNSALVANLGHTENVSTAEAMAWMDGILAKVGPSEPADVEPTTGWWDVTTYSGGSITESGNGTVTSSTDTGSRTLTVTLDGEPFTVTHYWGYYAENPNSPAQKISIYVPENVRADSLTYFRTNNSGWTQNPFRGTLVDGGVYETGNLTYNTTQGPDVYAELLDRGTILVSYGARSRADAPVNGVYQGHSPATMTDTKAAIRFLVHNQVYGSLPGDPERVIITGMSGGGALTAVVAASGNSSDYHPSLAEIGALGITEVDGGYVDDPLTGDNVFATFSSAPMIEQDIASEAHEWMYYPTRQKVADGAYADAQGINNGRNNPERLADWQLLASAVLSQGDGYPAYLESLGLKVKDIQRTMLEMVATSLERLLNEGVTYRPELFDVTAISNRAQAEEALKTYLRFAMNNPVPGFEELPLDWFTIAGKPGAFKVVITPKQWASVNEYMYWSAQFVKNPPATDQDGLVSNLGGAPGYSESSLYGGPDEPYNHVSAVAWALDVANWPTLGLTPSTNPDNAARQAENAELAKTLFEID